MTSSRFDEMNRVFDRFPFADSMRRSMALVGIDGNVSVEPTDGGYVVAADLPGFEADELELSVRDDVLVIEGSHDEAAQEGAVGHRRRQVHERVALPGPVRAEAATASYRNGVLEVTLPEEPGDEGGRRIDVE